MTLLLKAVITEVEMVVVIVVDELVVATKVGIGITVHPTMQPLDVEWSHFTATHTEYAITSLLIAPTRIPDIRTSQQ